MKRLSFFLALAVCIGVFLTLNAAPAFAQGETGSVTGVVTDAQGGTVAGAEVTLTDVATKSPRTTTTNDSGRYHVASVAFCQYDIMITKCRSKGHKPSAKMLSIGTHLT